MYVQVHKVKKTGEKTENWEIERTDTEEKKTNKTLKIYPLIYKKILGILPFCPPIYSKFLPAPQISTMPYFVTEKAHLLHFIQLGAV